MRLETVGFDTCASEARTRLQKGLTRSSRGLTWDPVSASPHLLQVDSGRTFLAFYLRGTEEIGVIEWIRCGGAVLGGLNDEAIPGHPLWKQGLKECLWAAEITNSRWIHEWQRANSGHPSHSPAPYGTLRHFVLLFKESTFECVARGFVTFRTRLPMEAALVDLVGHLDRNDPLPFEVVA